MADEKVFNLISNANQESSLSTGNELMYITAESDILNVSNDSVNQCLLKTQNENINLSTFSNDSFTLAEKSGDSNCNPVENFDLSISEAFAKMAVSNNSINDVTYKSLPCSSEPLDNEFAEIIKDELVPLASKPMIEESLNFQGESPKVNELTLVEKDEDQQCNINDLLPEIEENFSPAPVNIVNQLIEKNDDKFCKGDTSPLVGGICQNIEESLDFKLQIQSPLGSSVPENIASPIFSESMLSEQALSFMAGGDSSNELLSSMPCDLKLSHDVSSQESSVALKQDVEKHPTPKIGVSPQGINVISNTVPTNDNIFKVPAIPVKAVESIVVSPVNALSDNSEGESFPVLNSTEISGFQTSMEMSPENLPIDHSGPSNNRNNLLFINLEPCKLSETEVASPGLPEPRVFTDFKEERNGSEDNPFKVPEPPKDEEDEEFTDAVQFFKDPSSFQYLENIQTSLPTDSVPRSSLYVAFDPLHSKRVSLSQMQGTSLGKLIPESEIFNNISTPVKKHLVDASLRESLGVLISFDSPKPSAKVVPEENDLPVQTIAKQYSEEEHQHILKIHELTMQETYLKIHREFEQEMAKAEEKNKKLSSLVLLLRNCMEEISGVAKALKTRNEELAIKADELEKENVKVKDDVKTAGEDLQSVESTFSDFHKRYEQCKGMLKTYQENEKLLKAKLSELEQKNNTLQEQSHEALEKTTMEAMVAKKSSEGQVTVLKAQLKKAELKISSLESDLSQVKIENSKLGGICDDLMAKVSEG